MTRLGIFLPALIFGLLVPGLPARADEDEAVRRMIQLISPQYREEVLRLVDGSWRDEFTVMVLDLIPLSRDGRWNKRLIDLLKRKTGQSLGYDLDPWYEWLWSQEPRLHPLYPDYKATVYSFIDPKFQGYFSSERTTLIRLDEVRWGGVRQDGIPPLRSPEMIPAAEAEYLAPTDVVFGIAVDGDVRAYPRRILGWHEMFTDTIAGAPMTGVYCPLCGTMILYRDTHDGVTHRFGTSGFLYRSNKLMYDEATQSLWNTLWGRPVIGPLAGKEITLEREAVITTTWGEWRRRHPKSLVLALDTGYQRDYDEGAAYRDYFATDDLMFSVPELDRRLTNKAEVLGLVFAEHPGAALAISNRFLRKNRVYHDKIGDLRFVVLTDSSGGHRVYRSDDVVLMEWDSDAVAVDDLGGRWSVGEDALQAADKRTLPRLPSQGAFWFGWYAAYPSTRLID